VNSERVIELFNEATEKPPEEREAFLAASCRDQPELRQQLERRSGQPAAAGSFLKQAAVRHDEVPALVTEKTGATRSGITKLLEQIGEGGCWRVYMAEAGANPVRRMVALKVIKLGMDTKAGRRPLRKRTPGLALMDHPDIAKVLEAARRDTGRPFFVMELGTAASKSPTTVTEQPADSRTGWTWFVQICQAVSTRIKSRHSSTQALEHPGHAARWHPVPK